MSMLTVHCQLEDAMVRERTGHQPSYAEAKKMKSLTLRTNVCLSDWYSSDSLLITIFYKKVILDLRCLLSFVVMMCVLTLLLFQTLSPPPPTGRGIFQMLFLPLEIVVVGADIYLVLAAILTSFNRSSSSRSSSSSWLLRYCFRWDCWGRHASFRLGWDQEFQFSFDFFIFSLVLLIFIAALWYYDNDTRFLPIFLCPYLFLKLVSFLGANRTKSASVGPRLLRGAI